MENKKKLEINTVICDIRSLTEETLSMYEKLEINAACLVTTPAAQAMLGRFPVKIDAANTLTLTLEENPRFTQFNGRMKIVPGTAVPEEKTYLMVNGSLDIEAGSEETLKGYAAIFANGSVTCPKSIAGLLGGILTVNGSLRTYPDGCIRLKDTAILDRFFHLRVKQNALYYAHKRVVALDPGISFHKLAEKDIRFSTQKLLVSEDLAEAAVSLFDEQTDIVVLPEGCAYVDGDAELDETLIKRYGNRLYGAGDLTAGAKAAGVLDQVSFLRVDGDLLVARELKERVLEMDVEYGGLYIVGGTIVSGWANQTLSAYMLENAEGGLSAVACAHIAIDADVAPEVLREKLVSIIGCAEVTCASKEQMDVIKLLACDASSITLAQQESKDGDEKDTDVVEINTTHYAF